MTYLPNIPLPGDLLSDSQRDIKNNFTKANTSFGIDHRTFSDATVLNGYHTVIHQVPFSTTTSNPPNNQPVVTPTAVVGAGEIFSAEINDGNAIDTALYYLTGGNRVVQFTRNFQPIVTGNNGATFLAGGFILNFGRVTGLSGAWPSGDQILTYAAPNVAFTSAGYSVFTTFLGPTSSSSGDICINQTNAGNFHWEFTGLSSSSFDGFMWWSLGI